MSVLALLIAAGGVVAVGFLGAFLWAVRSGQFDDTAAPPIRMLFDDQNPPDPSSSRGLPDVHVRS